MPGTEILRRVRPEEKSHPAHHRRQQVFLQQDSRHETAHSHDGKGAGKGIRHHRKRTCRSRIPQGHGTFHERLTLHGDAEIRTRLGRAGLDKGRRLDQQGLQGRLQRRAVPHEDGQVRHREIRPRQIPFVPLFSGWTINIDGGRNRKTHRTG